MAYRFLLEVPDALYAQANVVISYAPDAGIVDVHEGIGGQFDNPGKTITLSAHSLDIVHRLHAWYADVLFNQADAAPVNYLLTNGTRMSVAAIEPGEVVAAIRRDQPWVERSIPKIGEHATRTAPQGVLQPAMASAAVRASGLASKGVTFLKQGQYQNARQHFDQALAIDPTNKAAMDGLAQLGKLGM